MKVNEIVNEGLWDGVKTVGKGLGKIAGGAATGVIRALDKSAGGTGVVGTPAQQAEYIKKQHEKSKAYVEKVLGDLGKRAFTEFSNILRSNKFEIQSLEELEPEQKNQMRNYLKSWTEYFFSDHNNRNKEQIIKQELSNVPVPTILSITNIQNYLNKAADIRKDVEENFLNKALKKPDDASKVTEPVTDISKTIANPDVQYRFMHPDYPGVEVIIRQTGYYYKQLPPELRGQVKRDKATGLYPVLRQENIKKLNDYYNAAADAGRVIEEPTSAL